MGRVFGGLGGSRSHAVHRISARAFALSDLLALVATSCLLLMLSFAQATSAQFRGGQAVCLSNMKRLTAAWLSFAHDHGDTLCGNADGDSRSQLTNTSWCAGWLGVENLPDNTNTTYLRDAQLGKYLGGDVSVFKCPSDLSGRLSTVLYPRVRSVSMNCYLGINYGPYTSGYYQFRKLGSLVTLPPSEAFVFMDEHEVSINDGWFAVDMAGFDRKALDLLKLVDYPAARHEGGASLSFADGHAETWRWLDPRTVLPPTTIHLSTLNTPDNPDVERLQSHASRRIIDPSR